ncbi:MAG: response regulator transcription factor [Oscillospiraceae bacterium]|nr:response regulator transcription factor [Oscillospiraceae bacterium]
MYTILICDDEPDIRSALRIYLTGEGMDVLEAGTGAEALELIAEHTVHLVLMDVMMPGMDGMTATARLREQSNVPVIMITAKSEDGDKILGLTVGADDYITKPFNPLEVMARVRAQLRRYARLGGMTEKSGTLALGGVQMDDDAKRVTLHGEEVALTPTEYDILRLLLENPGKVFSSREIYSRVWKDVPVAAESTVPVHIRHLREKLEIDPANPRLLKVVWGKGYKLEEEKR